MSIVLGTCPICDGDIEVEVEFDSDDVGPLTLGGVLAPEERSDVSCQCVLTDEQEGRVFLAAVEAEYWYEP